jgi:hypothetical protein
VANLSYSQDQNHGHAARSQAIHWFDYSGYLKIIIIIIIIILILKVSCTFFKEAVAFPKVLTMSLRHAACRLP